MPNFKTFNNLDIILIKETIERIKKAASYIISNINKGLYMLRYELVLHCQHRGFKDNV